MQKKVAIATNEWLSAEWFVTFWNICWKFILLCHILKYLLKIHNILSQTARNLSWTALIMPLISTVRWSDFNRSYNNYIWNYVSDLYCHMIWLVSYNNTAWMSYTSGNQVDRVWASNTGMWSFKCRFKLLWINVKKISFRKIISYISKIMLLCKQIMLLCKRIMKFSDPDRKAPLCPFA